MKNMVIACEHCNGVGWIETADPDNPEICRACLGTGLEPKLHERMVDLLLRESYSDGNVWRVVTGETQQLVSMGIPCKKEWHEVSKRGERPVCSCPAFCFGKGYPCKHIEFAPWLAAFRVRERLYEVPYRGGVYVVVFEPHRWLPAWTYRVHATGTTYFTDGVMPDWMYRQANRYFPGEPAWIPQFPVEKEPDYDPFFDEASAAAP